MNTPEQQATLFIIQIVSAATQIVSLVFLIIYVIKTWEMASATRRAAEATERSVVEMQVTRDQEAAPYVIAYFDIPAGSSLIYLVVKNIGRSIAAKVKLTFTPPLCTSDEKPLLEKLSFIQNGIASLPPNQEIRTLFDSAHAYFGKAEMPLQYYVKVSYYGGIQATERFATQTLDLSAYKGLLYVDHKGMDDLVKQLETLVREAHEIRGAASSMSKTLKRGVLISNSSLVVTEIDPNMSNWREILLAKAGEFEGLWLAYKNEDRDQVPDLDRLQAQALLLSEQLLTILTNRPNNARPDMIGSASAISEHLHQLGKINFYVDGGASFRTFNDLGDVIIQDIQRMREQDLRAACQEAQCDGEKIG